MIYGIHGFNPWVRKIPWRRKWQPTPVLLPGKSHEWRSLVGYSPQGREESDTTERLHFTYAFKEMLIRRMLYLGKLSESSEAYWKTLTLGLRSADLESRMTEGTWKVLLNRCTLCSLLHLLLFQLGWNKM